MPGNHTREEILTEPPLFTVEVVFRGEEWSELTAKCADHHAMGVGTILVVDPYKRTLFVAGRDGLLRQSAPPLMVDVPLTETARLRIDFEQLFHQLDED